MARARAKARTTSARARATSMGTRAATTGCTRKVERRAVRALLVPSRGARRVTASLKGPRYGKCHTCGGDHSARDCPKGGGKGGFRALEAWETSEEPPLVEHARVLSSLREAPPKHAGPQRVPRELRKKFMTCADMNCNCNGGHQQREGEVPAPPGLQSKGQDGEPEVKVSKKRQKSRRGSDGTQVT